jgi:hypothetical protein
LQLVNEEAKIRTPQARTPMKLSERGINFVQVIGFAKP